MLRLDADAPRVPSRYPATLATGVSVAGQGLLRLGTTVIIGQFGGAALLGHTASMMATAQIAALLGSSALGTAASKFVALARVRGGQYSAASTARKVEVWNALILLLVTPVTAGVWVLVVHHSTADGAILAALVVGLAVYPVYRGIQLGAGAPWRAAVVDLIAVAGALAGTVVIAAVAKPGPVLLLPLAAGYLIYAILSLPKRSPSSQTTVVTEPSRSLLTFTALSALGTLGSTGLAQAAVLATRIGGGEIQAGVYAAAVAITTPLSMASAAISMSVFPRLVSAMHSNGKEVDIHRSGPAIRSVAVLSGLVWPPYLISAPLVARLVWNVEFPGLEEVVRLLCLATGIVMAGTVAVSALTATSNHGAAISTLLTWTGVAAAISTWKATGVDSAAAVAAGYLVSTVAIGLLPLIFVAARGVYVWVPAIVKFTILLGASTAIDIIVDFDQPLRVSIAVAFLGAGILTFWPELRMSGKASSR